MQRDRGTTRQRYAIVPVDILDLNAGACEPGAPAGVSYRSARLNKSASTLRSNPVCLPKARLSFPFLFLYLKTISEKTSRNAAYSTPDFSSNFALYPRIPIFLLLIPPKPLPLTLAVADHAGPRIIYDTRRRGFSALQAKDPNE